METFADTFYSRTKHWEQVRLDVRAFDDAASAHVGIMRARRNQADANLRGWRALALQLLG
jgi:thioesterase domain-containing protein